MPEDRLPDARGLGTEDRFNNIEMFLKATQPEGYDEYYNPRSPLLGKELSVGYVSREDMLANDMMVWTILECFIEGQMDIAWDLMTWYQNDWKASMSIDAKLLERLTTQEVKYDQTQHVYEHIVPQKKKGLFGGK